MKLGFVGLGNMASAILGGVLEAGLVSSEDVRASCAHAESAQAKSEKFGVEVGLNNVSVVEASDVIFLSCKPQQYADVLAEIRGAFTEDANKVLITIAPGKTIAWVEQQLAGGGVLGAIGSVVGASQAKIVRCMPNTPALVGEGLTSYCPNENVTAEELAQVEALLDCVGKRVRLPEEKIDAASAVGGSAPAFVYAFIESLADGGVAEGLPRAQAYEIAAQTVLGSAKMVLETGEHPGALKDAVCSPGGTTIKGLEALERDGFRGSVINAVRTTAVAARGM